MRIKKAKWMTHLLVFLIILELSLALFSWLLSATATGDVRSLLSGEGLRWFLGNFSYMLLKPQLIWLLLLSMAYGCIYRSGILFQGHTSYRRAFSLRVSLFVLFFFLSIVVLLTALPQAILLSSSGTLWPSPLSRALVPLISALAIITASCYGLLSRTFMSLIDIYQSLKWGIEQAAPLFILYVFVIIFYDSVCYVF